MNANIIQTLTRETRHREKQECHVTADYLACTAVFSGFCVGGSIDNWINRSFFLAEKARKLT